MSKLDILSKDKEIKLLYATGKTCKEIGKIIGSSKSFVVKRLSKLGIKKRTSQDYFRGKKILGIIPNKRHHPEITTAEIIALYNMNYTGDEIALKYGVDRSCIYKRLREAGIKMRTTKDYIGDRHWRWKGHDYFPIKVRNRQSGKMKDWSNKVKKRDQNKCRNCGTLENLHAHHIIPYILCYEDERVFDINNGITVCSDCHWKIHGHTLNIDNIFSKTQ